MTFMLDTALKEWAIVGELLRLGRTTLLLRKGGVHEHAGPGRFSLEHDRFALFPAWEHEKLDWIKPNLRLREEPIETEPARIELRAFGEAARIWQVPSREAFDQLDDLHCWEKPQIDMRFNYKPDRPLYLLAVRAYQLPQPHTIANRPHFAGCRSWVPLEGDDQVDPTGSTPAIAEKQFNEILIRIDQAFDVAAS